MSELKTLAAAQGCALTAARLAGRFEDDPLAAVVERVSATQRVHLEAAQAFAIVSLAESLASIADSLATLARRPA